MTKLIKNLHKLPYEESLKQIYLPSLEYRQMREYMIQIFKTARNLNSKFSIRVKSSLLIFSLGMHKRISTKAYEYISRDVV